MQHLIILVILLLIAGLTFTVTKWRGGLHMTFSQHAATNRWSKIFYALLFLVTLPILMLFFVEWFVPIKDIPSIFLWFAAIAIIFQIACTWVPEEGGRKTVIHRILTGISAVALLPLVFIIATSSQLAIVRNIAWGGLLLMIMLSIIALTNKKGYRFALLVQISYYAIFFLIILTTTYL